MKMCITAAGESLESAVDPRFGRCQYFIIVDSDTMEFEAIENPSISATGGAGIQSAQSIANKDIEVLITGSVGPNAFPILDASGIKVVSVTGGSVADAIEQYKNGKLQVLTGPTASAHAGMGGGQGAGDSDTGTGRGAGGGGRGRGGGQGMGRRQ
ncbi:MAG TPA: dinitrogenase iron-molybdenum cofactor biosynthesis protein [Methanosarcinaceae archaeon]|nr:dinitrogenase iron-molybdenum cofactor biosynthesis protein [Methanosarcinaceae archaeon]HJH30941.1 dinitrogenase iron-molybdenum cofactor biosynthesis protein [Methanosarcinaceae archaeon]